VPPHDAPGEILLSLGFRPAGFSASPKQACWHGSDMQHPTNFVPVSQTYLLAVSFVLRSAIESRFSVEGHVRSDVRLSTHQVPPSGQKKSPGSAAT